jgi:mevalonate kinase
VRISRIASEAGCAAKPSGAGGGDCAVVLCFGDAARAKAAQALSSAGVPCFPVEVADAPAE